MSEMRNYLVAMRDGLRRLGHAETPLQDFMIEHGRSYEIGPETYAGKRAEPQQCYKNATMRAALDPELTYVEGKIAIFGIPIDHAWCIDRDGIVIDPTLQPSETDGNYDYIGNYFGVPFKTDYLRKACLLNGVYGLLDILSARETLPKLIELGLEGGQDWLLAARPKRKRAAR